MPSLSVVTEVIGHELITPSTSVKVVIISCKPKFACPIILIVHGYMLLISLSYAPPCRGLLSVMNIHLTPCERRFSFSLGDLANFVMSFDEDLEVVALSLCNVDGNTWHAQNLGNA